MKSLSYTERDEAAAIHATGSQRSRRDLALDRGFDAHPDDRLPPATHLLAAPGVDVLAAFAQEVAALRRSA